MVFFSAARSAANSPLSAGGAVSAPSDIGPQRGHDCTACESASTSTGLATRVRGKTEHSGRLSGGSSRASSRGSATACPASRGGLFYRQRTFRCGFRPEWWQRECPLIQREARGQDHEAAASEVYKEPLSSREAFPPQTENSQCFK